MTSLLLLVWLSGVPWTQQDTTMAAFLPSSVIHWQKSGPSQCHCLGPHHFDRAYTWPYGGLLVGTDPVAVDAVGLRILEAKRSLYFKEDSPMRPPVRHIAAAETKHNLGVADLRRIEVVKMGWKEGILI